MKNAKRFFSSFIIFCLLTLTTSLSAAEVRYFVMGPGKVMAYEWVGISNKNPTLILLPGVNRALGSNEKSVQLLMKQGFSVLLPSLPSHPLSIAGLPVYESPYFIFQNKVRVQDYAQDITALTESLKIQNAIPVSLSYSSGIAAYFDAEKFPRIIDTVPLVTPDETNPQAAATAAQLRNLARMNPFNGEFWLRTMLDQVYYNYWNTKVSNNQASSPGIYGENPRLNDIARGYVAIARAIEDFDLTKKSFAETEQTHDFILAGNEEPLRLEKQIQVVRNYIESKKPCRILVVQNSGHILPSEQPELYAQVVGALAASKTRAQVQFAIVEKITDYEQTAWGDVKAFEKWAAEKSEPQKNR